MRPHIFHRTLDIPGVHRAALRLVAVKQVLVGLTLEHGSKLPTQIMRVLNTTGETETAGRRMPMRRVTDQEYPPLAEFRRKHTLYRLARDLVDGHSVILWMVIGRSPMPSARRMFFSICSSVRSFGPLP